MSHFDTKDKLLKLIKKFLEAEKSFLILLEENCSNNLTKDNLELFRETLDSFLKHCITYSKLSGWEIEVSKEEQKYRLRALKKILGKDLEDEYEVKEGNSVSG